MSDPLYLSYSIPDIMPLEILKKIVTIGNGIINKYNAKFNSREEEGEWWCLSLIVSV